MSSLSISQDGELDLDLLQEWISNLLQKKGADIFRMKGVLAVAMAEQRFVYQAVHMIFNGDFTEAWLPGEERTSKLVFIGKNLDHDALKAAFAACLITAEMKEKKLKSLRFGIGDKVLARGVDFSSRADVEAALQADPQYAGKRAVLSELMEDTM